MNDYIPETLAPLLYKREPELEHEFDPNYEKCFLILFNETDDFGRKTGKTLVSHGITEEFMENVCLPPEPVRNFGAKYDKEACMWYIMVARK